MALLVPPPFKWRLDWFQPDHYIRLCLETKRVDTSDVLVVACATEGAARVASTKYFGDKNIDATAAKHDFNKDALKLFKWGGRGGNRRVLPFCVMKSILGDMKSPTAEKLFPSFVKLVEDIENDRVVPELVDETAIVPANHSVVLTAPGVPEVDSSILQLNRYNTTAVHTDGLIIRANKQRELVDVAAATYKIQHEAALEAKRAQTEHAAKIRKIEGDADLTHIEQVAKKRKIEEDAEHESQKSKQESQKSKLKGLIEFEKLATDAGFLNRSAQCKTRQDELWEKILQSDTLTTVTTTTDP